MEKGRSMNIHLRPHISHRCVDVLAVRGDKGLQDSLNCGFRPPQQPPSKCVCVHRDTHLCAFRGAESGEQLEKGKGARQGG